MSAEKVAHTPGPWIAQASKHGEYPHVYRPERIDKDGLKYWAERICVVYPSDADDDRVHHPVASANARLIAASPIMYEYIRSRAQAGDERACEILESVDAAR